MLCFSLTRTMIFYSALNHNLIHAISVNTNLISLVITVVVTKAAMRLSFIYIILFYCLLFCAASDDTITIGKPISDGGLVISKGRKFALGFFTPGKSRFRYVGIWYHNLSKQTVVWVANRDDPMNDTSGVLYLNKANGNLVLHQNSTNMLIWSTNVSVTTVPGSNTAMAQLTDIGNIVLIQNDSSKTVLWQSFDHPTDTILPYAKLGFNKRTGQNCFLQSWKTEDDPATGSISLRFNTSGRTQQFLYNKNVPLWRVGYFFNGEKTAGWPSMRRQISYAFNLTVIDNDNEVWTTYHLVDATAIFRVVIIPTGYMQSYKWDNDRNEWKIYGSYPEINCESYGTCGANSNCDSVNYAYNKCFCLPGFEPRNSTEWYNNDASAGCVRKKGPSMCGNGEGFFKVESVKIPDTSIVNVKKGLSMEECEQECLRNCSCNAYAVADVRNGTSECLMWYGTLMDTQVASKDARDLFVRVDATELAKYAKRSKRELAKSGKVGIVMACVTLIALLIAFFVYRIWNKRRRDEIAEQELKLNSLTEEGDGENRTQPSLPFFGIKTIMAATNNFSNENQLGQGGFGSVYKGMLVNGQEIAVKRLSQGSRQGTQEFKNEIKLIAKLQHRNLVKLLGYCIHKEERMLLYEYLPNKSLNFFLFDMNQRMYLNWDTRFHIVFGIARGLLYLHQDSRLKIIHRDLKASNVLLDATMNPKISDFGMARIFGEEQIQARTRRIVGTYGYMSPEYAMVGQYSTKSDVFSFGILLLEIISGKRNTDSQASVNLIGQVWDLWREGKALEIVDSTLGESYPLEIALRCIQIGLLCVQESAFYRPSMLEVIFMRGNEVTIPSPRKPAFLFNSNLEHSESLESGNPSVNDVSNTTVSAR